MIFRVLSRPSIQAISRRCLHPSSQKPKPEGKHYRLWMMPGDQVRRKTILARQYTPYWHPGLNVGIDLDRTIYSLCDGIMVITEEKFNPDWDYHVTKDMYEVDGDKRAPEHMRYIHVIPKPRVPEYRLIDLV